MSSKRPSPTQIWKNLPPEQQRALHATYAAMAKALPGATEDVMWGMPGFRIGKEYGVCVTGFTHHNSLFPGGGISTLLKKELAGYTVSKGTIQFAKEKPFPVALLKKILKARIAELNDSYPKSNGVMIEYYDNGFVKLEGKYKAGKQHGMWKYYTRDGSLKKSETFKNGDRIA